MTGGLVVFLGPSLSAAEARKLAPRCTLMPPARQGDVWRALEGRPKVICLIDGVFESTPSVWHHELLCAVSAGVRVIGGGSMGALRAAELHGLGVEGCGRIFEAFRDGVLQGDDEVALLHAGPEHGHRAFTVPLVNVRHTVAEAKKRKNLSAAEAKALLQRAVATHYQQRTWTSLLRGCGLDSAALPLLDLKADDARACLRAAHAAWVDRKGHTPPTTVDPRAAQGSSLLRVARLRGSPRSTEALAQLQSHPDAQAMAQSGMRRMLLSAWARSRGMTVTEEELVRERRKRLATRPRGLTAEAWLSHLGLDDAQVRLLLEDVLLERTVLAQAQRWVPDGPSWEEALASEARLRGLWPSAEKAPAAASARGRVRKPQRSTRTKPTRGS